MRAVLLFPQWNESYKVIRQKLHQAQTTIVDKTFGTKWNFCWFIFSTTQFSPNTILQLRVEQRRNNIVQWNGALIKIARVYGVPVSFVQDCSFKPKSSTPLLPSSIVKWCRNQTKNQLHRQQLQLWHLTFVPLNVWLVLKSPQWTTEPGSRVTLAPNISQYIAFIYLASLCLYDQTISSNF